MHRRNKALGFSDIRHRAAIAEVGEAFAAALFEEEAGGVIPLSDPDMTQAELDAVDAVLRTSRLSNGPVVEKFEAAFREYLGRKYAIAVPSGTIGLLITLTGMGIGPGDEVICSPYSFRETVHAVSLSGARPVLVDIM